MSAPPETGRGRWWGWLLTADYYCAASLLLVAGIGKLIRPGVSELLQRLWEQDILALAAMLAVSRWLPWGEIVLGGAALWGWRPEWWGRMLAAVYLFFAVLIALVARGYWAEPIECGCFGNGGGTPAYLLIVRNLLIAIPLFRVGSHLRCRSIFYRLTRRGG